MELKIYVEKFKEFSGEKANVDVFARVITRISKMMVFEFLETITEIRPRSLDKLFSIRREMDSKYDAFLKEISPIMEKMGVTFKKQFTFEEMLIEFTPSIHQQMKLGRDEQLKNLRENRRSGLVRF